MKVESKSLVFGSVVATVLILGTPAIAAKITPGLYNLADVQQVCLQSDGTWYYTTFSGNIGGWMPVKYHDAKAILWGSYNSGVGQDSIVVNRGAADWMEFHNDGSFVAFLDKGTFARVSDSCTAPKSKRNKHANPME